MKILIVTGIFPPDIGGPATYVPEIAEGLLDRGHEISVVTTSEPKWLDLDDSQYPFPVFRMNRRVHLGFRPFLFTKTILHHAKKVDVILANGVFLEATVACLMAGKSIVQKIVGDPTWERARNRGWTTDSFEAFQDRYQGLKVELFKKLRNLVARRADRIIVPSRYLASSLRKWNIPPNKISIIYNSVQSVDGVDPAHNPLSSPVKLVTTCRLVSWKRVDSIIRAVGQIDKVGLLICGDGPERKNLETLTKDLALNDRIYFAGQRNRKDTLALMTGCDVFVLNSTYEGFPHVILEAMSLGLPVIATSVGGTPELVRNGEAGLLIRASDAVALRSAILEVIGSPETLRAMREQTRVEVRSFSFPRMVRETEQVLQTVSGATT